MVFTINDLYARIVSLKPSGETMLIGIDGGGGAGKSTLSEMLKKMDADNTTIVHMDDFYKTCAQREIPGNDIGWLWDCARVKSQVLEPLSRNQSTRYQLYDWDLDKLTEWYDIPAGGVVIVEGCYSLIESFRDFYGFKIWVETSHDLRLARGVDRDGEEKRYLWEDLWMPEEYFYIKSQKPNETADLVIDGSGGSASIDNLEVNVLKHIFKGQ